MSSELARMRCSGSTYVTVIVVALGCALQSQLAAQGAADHSDSLGFWARFVRALSEHLAPLILATIATVLGLLELHAIRRAAEARLKHEKERLQAELGAESQKKELADARLDVEKQRLHAEVRAEEHRLELATKRLSALI